MHPEVTISTINGVAVSFECNSTLSFKTLHLNYGGDSNKVSIYPVNSRSI